MKIKSIHAFEGSNIYSLRPVVKAIVDVEELFDTPTKDIGSFNALLLEVFPGLAMHRCCLGYEGGFKDRLKEGTYLPHVLEHTIIELQNVLGYEVAFGKARSTVNPREYTVVYEYKNEIIAIECVRRVIGMINKIIDGQLPDINECLEDMRGIAAITDLGPSTLAIYSEAKKRQIPVRRLGLGSLLQLGYGKNQRLIQASMTDSPACIEVDIAGDKQLTKKILQRYDIPVPEGQVCYSCISAINVAEEIGYPVVVKPLDSNQGKGVSLCLSNEREVKEACSKAFEFSKGIIVEKYFEGRDYRVLVVGGKVAAVSMRRPPTLLGDGVHTVKDLLELENKNILRGEDHEKPLTKLKLDEIAKEVLKKQGINEYYIPWKGQEVLIRENGNLSTGGTAVDCTDKIHPDNCNIAIRATNCLNLDIAGIDITAKDISSPIGGTNGAVIEVNAAPGLRMHIHPTEGKSVDVANKILDMLYPNNKKASIPIVSVTGTNGKTTTTRMIAYILGQDGLTVGMTTTSGTFIDGECINKGDNTGPNSAQQILCDKRVEAAVLETARGGIVKRGLGYDFADVGVIVNVSEDHIGIDGIRNIEELAFAKSLVIEAVKEDGYCVLNADDKMTPYFMEKAKAEIILFAAEESNEILQKHLQNGGKGVTIENGILVLRNGEKVTPVIAINMIRITMDGLIACNIENSMAATAALFGLGIKVEAIKEGLLNFSPNSINNPGRFNIFDIKDFKVMVDYGHNPSGYKSVANFVKKLDCKRAVGIIGVPGDRQDELVIEVGKICARNFDRLYIKEDIDLRGRDPGEIADILYDTVIKEGMEPANVDIIYSETKALEVAMESAKRGDFIMAFFEDYDEVLKVVEFYKKKYEKIEVVKKEDASA